jgi:glycerophosphoryl diester phosphodiesterase
VESSLPRPSRTYHPSTSVPGVRRAPPRWGRPYAAGEPTAVVDDAHAAGLTVHVWTMRDENQFVAKDFWRGDDPNAKGDARAEIRAFLDEGIDGFFTDYPDTGWTLATPGSRN